MATTPTYINQRINNLQAQINAISPYPPAADSLAAVLLVGNSAGASNINMNNQNITGVNNIALTTINGSAYPPVVPADSLSAVLLVGNSAGASSINMNTNAISNISTATAKTSLVVNNAVTGANATLTQSNLTINSTGLNNNPSLTLNQSGVGNGILIEEFYNQRTSQTGEFNRMSFFAKSSTGTKIEYARIHQNAPAVITGSTRGRLDFALDVGGAMTDFLSLNASTNVVSCLRSLNMSNFGISAVPDIITPNGNPYGKIDVYYLNAPTANFPTTTPDSNIRATLFNQGLTPTIDPLVGNFPSTWGAITASANFSINGYTYVGTDNGLMYYSNDGATWFQVNVDFDGIIRGLKEFNGYLYIVGEFNNETVSSLTCNGVAKIDSGNSFFQITWTNVGGNGFNAKVKCLELSASGFLYIGGDFNNTDIGSLSMGYIAIVDAGDNLYCMDNTSGTGYGFDNSVYFIKENASAPNVLIIGGNFSSISTIFGGLTVTRNAIWTTNGSYDTSVAPYQVVAFNAVPRCITSNGNQNYIGGDFTGLTYGDYLVSFDWDGANYVEATFPPSLGSSGSPVNNILQAGGVWFTNTALELYQTGVLIGTSPTGANWSAIIDGIWGQKLFSTISPSQNPVVAYFINSTNNIVVTLVGGYKIKISGLTYTGGITLSSNGSNVDMIYNVAESAYYVVNYFGGVGFF